MPHAMLRGVCTYVAILHFWRGLETMIQQRVYAASMHPLLDCNDLLSFFPYRTHAFQQP